MPRKSTTPAEITEALALREAGYTVLSISQRLNISPRTVQRHLSSHGAKKGGLRAEVIHQARNEMLRLVTSDDTIRHEASRLISDDLAHSRHVRSILVEASGHLKADSLRDAVLVMRAAAAYSTVVKNTSDTLRHTLRLERVIDSTPEELPVLNIREMNSAEIEVLAEPRPTVGDHAIN